MSTPREQQLEAFIRSAGLDVPPEIVRQIEKIDVGNRGFFPLGDVRLTDKGVLVMHPKAVTYSNPTTAEKRTSVMVTKNETGLTVSYPRSGLLAVPSLLISTEYLPTFNGAVSQDKLMNKGWNRITEVVLGDS